MAKAEEDAPATKFAKEQLKAVIERVERLEEEKKTLADDIRDVYAEAKGNGFDVTALKELLRDGLIERPTRGEQYANPGWAYRTTVKGATLVNAICSVPNPVERTRWVIPS